jgi:hypothetical protein
MNTGSFRPGKVYNLDADKGKYTGILKDFLNFLSWEHYASSWNWNCQKLAAEQLLPE